LTDILETVGYTIRAENVPEQESRAECSFSEWGQMLIHRSGQCFSTFVRPRLGKFYFRKTRARSQQICSSVPFQIFISSYIKLTQVLIINYGIIIKSISTIMFTVWHVDKYKITIKLFINSKIISRGPVKLMPGPGIGPRPGV